jgi:hypothetical protein
VERRREDAVLVETPLNDGQPFSDTLFYYNTDEPSRPTF